MIRITRQADYGIVLMTRFSLDSDRGMHTATDLAAETNLPLPMVSKILKVLTKDGLLVSHRGAHGGYSLARKPEKISVLEMIDALEGPIAMTQCGSGELNPCEHEADCPTAPNWQKINGAVRKALAGLTLREMAQPLIGKRSSVVASLKAKGVEIRV